MRPILCIVFSISLLQGWWWSPPENLGIVQSDDKNPQACRLHESHTCVVWQSNLNGNWDIFSRFSEVGSWSDTFRITSGSYGDVNPSVAYDYTRNCFWCAWQYEPGDPDVYISQGNAMNGWSTPYQLTDDPLRDVLPSVCVMHDTVWVVWTRGMSFGDSISYYNIHACYYDGTSWSAPTALTNDSAVVNWSPKINVRYNHPFVVWQKTGYGLYADIYYSEYLDGSWQVPQSITNDPYENINPEIASLHYYDGYSEGVWVVWQTDRDGNYEIYATGYDSLDVHYRKTFHDSADGTPSPLYFIALIRQGGPPITALSTNRNGNDDIYTLFSYWQDTLIQVDTSHAQDILPVMTGEDLYVWCLWQTDRHGEWDIYGSYIFVGGVEELNTYDVRSNGNLTIAPNPFSKKTDITYSIGHNNGVDSRQKSVVSMKIYDATGRLIKQFSRFTPDALHLTHISWDGTDDNGQTLPQGVYFVQLENRTIIYTQKVVLVK